MDPGWHVDWINSEDPGLATEVRCSRWSAQICLHSSRQRNRKLPPYIPVEARQTGIEDADTEYSSDLGVDLKYSYLFDILK
jgi:hypothetical protein